MCGWKVDGSVLLRSGGTAGGSAQWRFGGKVEGLPWLNWAVLAEMEREAGKRWRGRTADLKEPANCFARSG